MRLSSQITRGALVVAAAGTLVAGMAACSSNNSSSDASASASTSTSSTSSASPSGSVNPTGCSAEALAVGVPGGGTVVKYACGNTGSKEIAAIRYNPGNKLEWLYVKDNKWQTDNSIQNEVCGGASAGLPDALLAMCPSVSPSPSTSKSKK